MTERKYRPYHENTPHLEPERQLVDDIKKGKIAPAEVPGVIHEIVSHPQAAYEAFASLPVEIVRDTEIAVRLANGIAKDPALSYEAGFVRRPVLLVKDKVLVSLAEGVSQDATYAYKAVEGWPKKSILVGDGAVLATLVRGISASPAASRKAFLEWPDDYRGDVVLEHIIHGIVQDHKQAYEAVHDVDLSKLTALQKKERIALYRGMIQYMATQEKKGDSEIWIKKYLADQPEKMQFILAERKELVGQLTIVEGGLALLDSEEE